MLEYVTTTKRTALITGANKGIGLETARKLVETGYFVWLGSRDPARGRAAADAVGTPDDVRPLALDVTDARTVAEAAAEIEASHGALDALVNNAGVALTGGEGGPSAVDIDIVRKDLDVNFFGALRVIQTFLPLVRKSPGGRIVNVSTTLASLGTLTQPASPLKGYSAFAYPASKTALNTVTVWLAAELADTSIKVNSVCPGINKTDMNPDPSGQHPSEGAVAIVRAATLPADGPTGTFFDVNGPIPW